MDVLTCDSGGQSVTGARVTVFIGLLPWRRSHMIQLGSVGLGVGAGKATNQAPLHAHCGTLSLFEGIVQHFLTNWPIALVLVCPWKHFWVLGEVNCVAVFRQFSQQGVVWREKKKSDLDFMENVAWLVSAICHLHQSLTWWFHSRCSCWCDLPVRLDRWVTPSAVCLPPPKCCCAWEKACPLPYNRFIAQTQFWLLWLERGNWLNLPHKKMLNYPFKCSLLALHNTGNQEVCLWVGWKSKCWLQLCLFQCPCCPETHTYTHTLLYLNTHRRTSHAWRRRVLGPQIRCLKWWTDVTLTLTVCVPALCFQARRSLGVVRVFICQCLRVSVLWDIFKEWFWLPEVSLLMPFYDELCVILV